MTEKIFGSNDKPTFIKEKRHTKGLVYGEITDCFIQRAFVNGYENDSMWRCRTTFGYRYVEGQIYRQMGPLQRPGDEDFSVGRGGGSSDLNTPPGPRPLPKVDEDKSFKNTKADCVYDKLKEGGPNSIMNQLLGGYMLDKKKIQLTFKVAGRDIFKKDNVNGITRYHPNTKTSVIYLNNKTLTQSPLEIARTILHECFHAYLHSINPKKMNSDYSASFEKLIDNYNVKNGDYTHNDMANKYRDEIERGLRAFVNTNEDLYSWANQKEANDSDFNMDDLLESLAWEGLQSTKLFNEKYANNKSLYEEEIVKYRKLLVNENGDFGTLPKKCD